MQNEVRQTNKDHMTLIYEFEEEQRQKFAKVE
jgi:hypothetical protein